MAILLVNNYLRDSEAKIRRYVKVLEALADTDILVVRFHDVKPGFRPEEPIDAIVLSGSEACLSRLEDRPFFEGEAELVRKARVPVLGICFGHQLIALAFGADVINMGRTVEGVKEVVVEVPDHIFASWPPGDRIVVYERHEDKVAYLPPGFVRLATSDYCEIEAMMHLRRPIFGVQFHPEVRPEGWGGDRWDGLEVLRNFLALSGLTRG